MLKIFLLIIFGLPFNHFTLVFFYSYKPPLYFSYIHSILPCFIMYFFYNKFYVYYKSIFRIVHFHYSKRELVQEIIFLKGLSLEIFFFSFLSLEQQVLSNLIQRIWGKWVLIEILDIITKKVKKPKSYLPCRGNWI